MSKLKLNPNNKKYYSEDFVKGFECGVERQYAEDMKENTAEWIHVRDVLGDYFRCSNCHNCKNIPTNFCDHCGYKMSVRKEMKGDTE